MRSLYFIGCALLFAACSPESSSTALHPLPQPSFTAVPLATNPNKVVVESTTPGDFLWLWNYGTSGVSRLKRDTLAFSKKGEYTIQLTVFTQGGFATTAQKVNIAADMPAVDILKGGSMDDAAAWTQNPIGGSPSVITIANGVMKFTNTGDSNGAIYQELTVKAGRQYTLSADISGGGATNTWFELVIGTAKPVSGTDYAGKAFLAMNTWAGCGNAPFSGNFATVACDGDGKGKGGNIKFDKDGKVYLVIKAGSAGGNFGPDGITLDNLKFMEEQ